MPDEYFQNLRRSAIVMTPKQPFFDWLLMYDPQTIIDDEIETGTIYLLPDYETRQEIDKWLRKNFSELFEEELHSWYIDETMWPQHRTFKMFEEWFRYSLHPLIFDTQQGFIEKI